MKKLRIGIVGLGRLGKVHAGKIAYKIPNAELTAACSIVPAELEYAIEVQEFVDCVLGGKTPGVNVYDGTKSTAIGYATTEAWKTGKIVKIN